MTYKVGDIVEFKNTGAVYNYTEVTPDRRNFVAQLTTYPNAIQKFKAVKDKQKQELVEVKTFLRDTPVKLHDRGRIVGIDPTLRFADTTAYIVEFRDLDENPSALVMCEGGFRLVKQGQEQKITANNIKQLMEDAIAEYAANPSASFSVQNAVNKTYDKFIKNLKQ